MSDRSDLTLRVTPKGALAAVAHLAECDNCRAQRGPDATLAQIGRIARAALNEEPLS